MLLHGVVICDVLRDEYVYKPARLREIAHVAMLKTEVDCRERLNVTDRSARGGGGARSHVTEGFVACDATQARVVVD